MEEPRLVSLDQGAPVLSQCSRPLSLSVMMRAVTPHPDNMAMIKGLADLIDQINGKVKAVMLRVDECEKRLDAQQALARVGGAFKSGGVRSDTKWLMDASQELGRSDLFDPVADDRTPRLPQNIKIDMRDPVLEDEETASESVPFRSVQRDSPAPKVVVRPPHRVPPVSVELKEDVGKVGEAPSEEEHVEELVDPREDSREQYLEERSLEVACAARNFSSSTESPGSSTPRAGGPPKPPSPTTSGRFIALPVDVGVCQLPESTGDRFHLVANMGSVWQEGTQSRCFHRWVGGVMEETFC